MPWDPQLLLDDLPTVPAAAAAQQPLTVDIRNASSGVRPGEPFRFDIRLSNPTDRDISLDPCPAYLITLDDTSAGDAFAARLPCDAAPTIPAKGHVDFEMELDPLPDGYCTIGWRLWHPTFNPPYGWASIPLDYAGKSPDGACP